MDRFFEPIAWDQSFSFVKYVRTRDQLTDVLTKGSFSSQRWKTLPLLWQIQTNVNSTPVDSHSHRSCFATTVFSKDVGPMASASQNTRMRVDTSKEPVCVRRYTAMEQLMAED